MSLSLHYLFQRRVIGLPTSHRLAPQARQTNSRAPGSFRGLALAGGRGEDDDLGGMAADRLPEREYFLRALWRLLAQRSMSYRTVVEAGLVGFLWFRDACAEGGEALWDALELDCP